MSWLEQRDEYEQLARSQSPHVVLVTKDHWLWRVTATLLWMASWGRLRRDVFLEQFATTIGPLQAYPRHWDTLPPWLIVHESRHSWQCEQFGWFVPILGWCFGRRLRTWVGLLPMALVYGCFPLPVLLAWGRMRLELDADVASWKAALSHGWQTPAGILLRAAAMADLVAGPSYLWAWPKSWTHRAFMKAAQQVVG